MSHFIFQYHVYNATPANDGGIFYGAVVPTLAFGD